MSLLRPRSRQLCLRSSSRGFSSTATRPNSLQIDRNDPEAVADTVPAYPYGPARWYKQSNKGLYGGQRIQFGNNVSGDFNAKTRRTFQVNVLRKRLWSDALGRSVQVRVSARTLRTIDRVGGLDEYVLGDKEARIKQLGVSGWWLRWAIMQQPSIKARFEKERWDLGLASRDEYENKLKELEAGNVRADLEQAYAALPDEGEAEAVQAADEQDARDEASATVEDAVEGVAVGAAEDVFAIENPSDLPPLKFRVDRRKHVVLTPNGWVRTRPDSSEYTKKWLADHHFGTYIETRMKKFEEELERIKKNRPDMKLLEEREILNAARRTYTKEMKQKVDRMFENQKSKSDERRARKTTERAKLGNGLGLEGQVAAEEPAPGETSAFESAAQAA